MGNYQFNKNIDITILWLIPEAYYMAYDVLIADLFKEIPLPLNISWQKKSFLINSNSSIPHFIA